jgi:hypothetical protein
VTTYTLVFLLLFLATGLIALRFGGAPERIGAVIVLTWALSDVLYHTFLGRIEVASVDVGHFVIDGTVLVAVIWLALRADRLWPLWAAGAQLICFTGHLIALIEADNVRRAYWAMTQTPQYVQLGALLIGTYRHARRKRRDGIDIAWRAASPAA